MHCLPTAAADRPSACLGPYVVPPTLLGAWLSGFRHCQWCFGASCSWHSGTDCHLSPASSTHQWCFGASCSWHSGTDCHLSPASGTHQWCFGASCSWHSGTDCHLSPGTPAPRPRSCSVAEDWLAMWSKKELPAPPLHDLAIDQSALVLRSIPWQASLHLTELLAAALSAHTGAGGCTRCARTGRERTLSLQPGGQMEVRGSIQPHGHRRRGRTALLQRLAAGGCHIACGHHGKLACCQGSTPIQSASTLDYTAVPIL